MKGLYYDARSEKHQVDYRFVLFESGYRPVAGCCEHEHEHLALHKLQAISWLCTGLLIARTLLHKVLTDDNGGCDSSSSKKKESSLSKKEYRGSRGTAPLILNLDTRLRYVVNFTPRPLIHRERTLGGWVDPRTFLNVLKRKFLAFRDSNPGSSSE